MQTPDFWQSRFPACLLLPLSWLFGLLSLIRRQLYAWRWLDSSAISVPVVVVGNINAGGAGKTPVVQHLAAGLLAAGFKPGIISRGYGGTVRGIAEVPTSSAPALFGDEPVLLANRTACPVFVGHKRADVAQALLAKYPATNVILSDDGLQHYALRRDIEIAVIDGSRGLQNGWLLPAGPLREGPARLAQCDAIVINGEEQAAIPHHAQRFAMKLVPGQAYALLDDTHQTPLAAFANTQVAALAGIGNPARFFATLHAAGLYEVEQHPFPDHHRYTATDLGALIDKPILVTEKDAVKLAALLSEGSLPHSGNIWVVPVAAACAPDLTSWLISRLPALTEKS